LWHGALLQLTVIKPWVQKRAAINREKRCLRSARISRCTVKGLLRHLQRNCHYARTEPRGLEDAKVWLGARAIAADAVVAEVIEMRNDGLIHGYPSETFENVFGSITEPEFADIDNAASASWSRPAEAAPARSKSGRVSVRGQTTEAGDPRAVPVAIAEAPGQVRR
jgi:hypothetical protein